MTEFEQIKLQLGSIIKRLNALQVLVIIDKPENVYMNFKRVIETEGNPPLQIRTCHVDDEYKERKEQVLEQLRFNAEAVNYLNENQKQVINLFYGLNGHLETKAKDIAKSLSVTSSAIYLIRRRALRKLYTIYFE